MQAGEVVSGRFRIDQRAGSGGMGSVYRATDQHTGEAVALKLLHPGVPDGELRFAREAAALARMSHPSVVRYVGHGTSGKVPFVAMEWLEGEDLGHRLRRQGLTLAETVDLGRRVAEALGHAHALGIVHRDVKPANLFFRDGDLAKLCVVDFGLARLTGDATGFHTAAGTMLGTPGYMAPEQARGTVDMDARVDVFALGCVLYKCLTGQGPFAGPDAVATLAKVLFDDPPRLGKVLPGAPADLEELLAQMLDKAPAARPRDGAEVAERLARANVTEATSVRVPAAPSQAVLTSLLQNLGLLRHLQGRNAESIALQRPAIEIFATQGDRRLGAFSHYYLSMALDAEGRTDEALEEARAAVRVAEPLLPTYSSTLAGLANLELRHGLPKEQALAHAEQAFEILQKLGGLEDTESRVRLSHAELLIAVGRLEDAKVALGAACDGILERASKITNARWRDSFLHRIPEHTKTFALAREVGVEPPKGAAVT